MTTRTRASAFAPLPEPELDVSGFAPRPRTDIPAPEAERVREISEAARFPSREAVPRKVVKATKREKRVYRTGRNVQFSVKAQQSTVDAFYKISDKQGWVLGETLDQALAALQRELERKNGNPLA